MIPWNPCPPSRGIRAHLAVEFVPAIAWNSQPPPGVKGWSSPGPTDTMSSKRGGVVVTVGTVRNAAMRLQLR